MTRFRVANLDRSLQLQQDGLRDEDFASLGAQVADLGLEKLDLLARPAAPHLQETVDNRVEVDFVLVCHCSVFFLAAREVARAGFRVSVMTDRSQPIAGRNPRVVRKVRGKRDALPGG
jgi:hypothetical protein